MDSRKVGLNFFLNFFGYLFIDRFSPYESELRDPEICTCGRHRVQILDDVESLLGMKKLLVVENAFTAGNSFWFTVGSLMQQGSDLNPKVLLPPDFF